MMMIIIRNSHHKRNKTLHKIIGLLMAAFKIILFQQEIKEF
jgi:hypothetical protein